MTNAQKIRLRLSQVRQRLNEIAGVEGDAFTDEVRSEAASLQAEFADLETRHQAAIVAEGEGETRATGDDLDAEAHERLELRSQASLTAYLRAALSGRQVDGREAELRDAAGIGDGIPLELWDVPSENGETRQDAPTGAPGTVGVNLDRIRPAVFAASIASTLGIEMPRVESGSYGSATISTSLSAASQAKGDSAQATAAGFTVSSVTPKRISARLGIRVEDVAAVGQANFESILRENTWRLCSPTRSTIKWSTARAAIPGPTLSACSSGSRTRARPRVRLPTSTPSRRLTRAGSTVSGRTR